MIIALFIRILYICRVIIYITIQQLEKMKNKTDKREVLRISCDSDKALINDFDNFIGTVMGGKEVTTRAEVQRALIEAYLEKNKVITKEDIIKGNAVKGTISVKLQQIIFVLMKYNRKAKKDDRVFIDATLLRSIAGTDPSGTKKHVASNDVKEAIQSHHETYGIVKDHNVKFRKRSEYPVMNVTPSRNIKVFFYEMMKKDGLLELLGLDNIKPQ